MKVILTTSAKYKNTLFILHQIEDKYGSISKAPNNDPLMSELRIIYPITNEKNKQRKERALELGEIGFSIPYIVHSTTLSETAVIHLLQRNRIKPKQSFIYRITSPNGKKYYTRNIRQLFRYVFHFEKNTNSKMKTYLEERNWKVKRSIFYWSEIRHGSYFLLPYMKKPMIKNGPDDYIYPPK